MGSAPRIRNFGARIDLQPGAPSRLYVVDEVETSAGNKQLRAEPQGIVPEQLILDLTTVDVGDNDQAAGKGQFISVQIRWSVKAITTLDVDETH